MTSASPHPSALPGHLGIPRETTTTSYFRTTRGHSCWAFFATWGTRVTSAAPLLASGYGLLLEGSSLICEIQSHSEDMHEDLGDLKHSWPLDLGSKEVPRVSRIWAAWDNSWSLRATQPWAAWMVGRPHTALHPAASERISGIASSGACTTGATQILGSRVSLSVPYPVRRLLILGVLLLVCLWSALDLVVVNVL